MVYSTKLIDSVLRKDIKIVRLSDSYDIKPFDCGVPDLNEFLFNDAKTYLKYLSSTTFLFENDIKTIAYYSLLNDLLNIDPNIDKEFEQEIIDIIADKDYSFLLEMKGISMFPAAKIGRFAVDKSFQRYGYGTEILQLIVMSFLSNNKTGCQFITVDALNNMDTLRFYEKNGFSFVTLADYNRPSRQMYKNLIALKQVEYLQE
ncbi:MAG: GNAT family N-acetyltransferase [Candidatus Symbiothrix sp.]|jgi:GNAT superfamily N-acetyltransferase|nr:GNAT family N-acetyltransferase [Candidatus Symbiothrix sp.]